MGESRSHIELVNIAFEYIKTLVPQEQWALIEVDSADSNRPTIVTGRFIPDVQFWNNDVYIIGEAKTINDFEREHSRNQYEAYISECGQFHGQATLVVAVPWQLVMTAKNYFRRRKKDLNYVFDVVILNELGGVYRV